LNFLFAGHFGCRTNTVFSQSALADIEAVNVTKIFGKTFMNMKCVFIKYWSVAVYAHGVWNLSDLACLIISRKHCVA